MLRVSTVRRKTDFRRVHVNRTTQGTNDAEHSLKPTYTSNIISTSKYTVLTFIPKNLFEQFRRVANIFFLGLTILQFFPDYMIIDPYVAALPFVFVLFATAIKDAVEDTRRHSSDRKINSQEACVLSSPLNQSVFRTDRRVSTMTPAGKPDWIKTSWGTVKVGDIVLLRKDDPIPADILILNTSEDGLCYTETKNLDGETNLKIRKGMLEMETLQRDDLNLLNERVFYVDAEHPNPNLYTFVGTAVFQTKAQTESLKDVTIDEFDPSPVEEYKTAARVPLTINSMLLRGCILRNTEWVVGLALYTGKDTKICLNSGETPSKQSKIDKLMNPQILINLAILVVLCIINCAASPVWESSMRPHDGSQVLYLASTYESESTFTVYLYIGFVAFWTSVIAFQNIVPISLYITIEVVKTVQSYFIYNDIEMYYEPLDQPCVPKSWNLSDDLGQIEYVFSDKTGTLTRNMMQFKKCSINGVVYGEGEHDHIALITPQKQPGDIPNAPVKPTRISLTEIAKKNTLARSNMEKKAAAAAANSSHGSSSLFSKSGKRVSPEMSSSTGSTACQSSHYLEELKFVDPHLSNELMDVTNAQYAPLRDFFTTLAVCHSVLISKDEQHGAIKYNAQSPDEAALVQAARDIGFVFKARGNSTVIVDALGEDEVSQLLNVIEFNSTRKRMSVIVRRPAGEIVLYCKGADSIIYERLAPGQDDMRKITSEHLEEFAEDGLRTLCIAYAILPPELYLKWAEEYAQASTSLDDRDHKMDTIADAIEKNLILMGATAIEDKLQEGVPECIQTLLSAGIKLWVLTGDKMETAINIGLSCNLLTREMNLILVKGSSEDDGAEVEETRQEMSEALLKFFGVREVTEVKGPDNKPKRVYEQAFPRNRTDTYSLVIDGAALKNALSEDQKQLFLELATRCAAVICCRVSPLQKAQVVELVKNSTQSMCLAIGDGANDVSMIQAAHIGIGIAGEEGLQAVMASDYAIAQFRFLSRLLLVHGHWSYIRTAELILNFFFKNIIWVMVLFWYQAYCGFSSQMVYDQSYMIFFNLLFTSLPVMIIGIFDEDIGQNFLMTAPPLYQFQASVFNLTRFSIFMIEACYQSLAFFFITLWACANESEVDVHGRTWGLGDLGVLLSICGVLHANVRVIFSFNSWTALSGSFMLLVMAILVAFSVLYARSPDCYTPGIWAVMYPRPSFWLVIVLQLVVCQMPRIVYLIHQRTVRPTNIQIMQEICCKNGATITPELRNLTVRLTEAKRYSLLTARRQSLLTSPLPSTDPMTPKLPAQPAGVPGTHAPPINTAGLTPTDSLSLEPQQSQAEPPPVGPNLGKVGASVSEYAFPGLDNIPPLASMQSMHTGMYSMNNELRTPISPLLRTSTAAFESRDSAGGLTVMKTGEVLRNRGYSFSQSPGAREIIMGRRRTEIGEVYDSAPLLDVTPSRSPVVPSRSKTLTAATRVSNASSNLPPYLFPRKSD
ncbi:hypothetical protein HDU81_001721 [Chytriomyces hyalinus]|nr:hypothetical protein HDU81_001721 [Chytriomyces hyalinus]